MTSILKKTRDLYKIRILYRQLGFFIDKQNSNRTYFNVVFGVTPVSLGVQMPQLHGVYETEVNLGDGSRDLARYKVLSSARTLVVEQDTVAREHVVRFSVVDHHPVRIQLGDSCKN